MSWYAVAGILSVVISLVIGLASTKLIAGRVDGYYVAGRQASGWLIWGTFLGNWISAATFVGVMGLVWQLGPVRGLWNYGSLWGITLFAFFIAIALRRARLLTVPDFFWEMWRNRAVHVLAVVLLIVAQLVYMVSQILAMGKVYTWIFNIDFVTGTLLFTAVVAIYVVVGGMWADITTDFIQTLTFVVAALVAAPVAIWAVGGWPALTHELVDLKPGVWSAATPANLPPSFLIGLFFSWLALTASSPYLISRAFAAQSEIGLLKGLIGSQLVATIFIFLLFPAGAAVFLQQQAFDDPDLAGLHLLQNMVPLPVGMLMVAAILASALSTVDSLALVVGQAAARDIYQRYVNPEVPERRLLLFSRVAVGASVIIAMLGALTRPALVIWVAQFAAAIFLASYLPAILLSLYWKRATSAGIFWGMLIGTIVYPLLQLVEASMGAVQFASTFFVSAITGGFLAALAVMVVVSVMTRSSPEEAERVAAFRARAFPGGRILALRGKVSPGDWNFLWAVVAVNLIFLVAYFWLLTT